MNRAPGVRRLVTAVGWLLSTALVLLVEVLVPLAWPIPWNPLEQTISDLGAVGCGPVAYADGDRQVCSPWHPLANAGWVLSGLALAAGAVTARGWLTGRAGAAAVVLLVLTGLSIAATGVAPVDTQPELHLLVAAPAFLTGNAALVLVALALRGRSTPLSRTALALGLIGAVGAVLTTAWVVTDGPLGLWERLAVYPVQVWVVLPALTLLRRRAVTAAASST